MEEEHEDELVAEWRKREDEGGSELLGVDRGRRRLEMNRWTSTMAHREAENETQPEDGPAGSDDGDGAQDGR